jgi:hypothetical protein
MFLSVSLSLSHTLFLHLSLTLSLSPLSLVSSAIFIPDVIGWFCHWTTHTFFVCVYVSVCVYVLAIRLDQLMYSSWFIDPWCVLMNFSIGGKQLGDDSSIKHENNECVYFQWRHQRCTGAAIGIPNKHRGGYSQHGRSPKRPAWY